MMTGPYQTDQTLARTVPLPGSPLLELPSSAPSRLPAGRSVNRPRNRAFTRCSAPAPIPGSTPTGRCANVCACRSPIAGPFDHRAVPGRGANVCATLRPITSPRARAGCFPRSANVCAAPTDGWPVRRQTQPAPSARRAWGSGVGWGAIVCATLPSITSPRARAGCFPRSANVCAGCRPACGNLLACEVDLVVRANSA
jgi:hypothetical protein